MREKVDIVIVTDVPAFYKINLYNELSQKASIHVFFIGLSSAGSMEAKNFRNDVKFRFTVVNSRAVEKRNIVASLVTLVRGIVGISYSRIVVCGWDLPEFQCLLLVLPRKRNCIELESSIAESATRGVPGFAKRLLVRRATYALPSGHPHSLLLHALGYHGRIKESGGVGIIRKNRGDKRPVRTMSRLPRFLFVGRLVPVKNLDLLIRTFNLNGHELTIVGAGPLRDRLVRLASPNICFHGFVPNDELSDIYRIHDVLVLPSISETWGLVVEEAIYYGLPVIVSDNVGCHYDIVERPQTGLVFRSGSLDDLNERVRQIIAGYPHFAGNCAQFEFEERDRRQVDSYLQNMEPRKPF